MGKTLKCLIKWMHRLHLYREMRDLWDMLGVHSNFEGFGFDAGTRVPHVLTVSGEDFSLRFLVVRHF